jgi:hypothetical protein
LMAVGGAFLGILSPLLLKILIIIDVIMRFYGTIIISTM